MLNTHRPKKTKKQLWYFASLLCASLFFSSVSVAQQSSSASAFHARLLNIEAPANEPFRYNATLHNAAAEAVVYEFKADLPPGWQISYRVEGSQVTSVQLEPGRTQDIGIEINSTLTAEPKKYKIPIRASSATNSFDLNLEAVVKGSYGIELSTPSGRLSDEIISGSSKELNLVVKNTGTLPLNNVELSSQLPSQWEATFEPASIEQLEPGKSMDIKTTVKVPDKTIAGDYLAKLTAKNTNKQSEVSFRIMVKVSILSGWIGIVIILLAVGLIYFLIRKYGRR